MNKILQYFKKLKVKGNVLAITLIVGGIAGVTAISIFGIILSDSKIAGQREDSLLAYQAASAGVDLGLMYYKYNHNVQLSNNCENTNDPANCQDPTSSIGRAIRLYIDRLGCADTGNNADPRDLSPTNLQCAGIRVNGTEKYRDVTANLTENLPSDERIVDIKIWFKDTSIGNSTLIDSDLPHNGQFNFNDNYDPSVSRVVKQDDAYQIDGLQKVDKFQLYLRPKDWAMRRNDFRDEYPNKWPEDVYNQGYPYRDWFQKTFCKQSCLKGDPTCQAPIDTNIPNLDLCGYYVIKVPSQNNNKILGLRESLKYIKNGVDAGHTIILGNTSAAILVDSIRIRPINMDLQFAIDGITAKNGDTLAIDSGITHIEVTGYYGHAKRKLEVQIDRKTNAFLGIFDRALYVSEGDLDPSTP